MMRGKINYFTNLTEIYYGDLETENVPKKLFASTKSGQGHGERSICYLLTGKQTKPAQAPYLQNTYNSCDICVDNKLFEVKNVGASEDVRVGITGYEFVWQVSNYLEQIYTDINRFKNTDIIPNINQLIDYAWVKIKKRYFSRNFIGLNESKELSVKELINTLPVLNKTKELFDELVNYINTNICKCFNDKLHGVFFVDSRSTKFIYTPINQLNKCIEFSRISTHAKIKLTVDYNKKQ